MNLRNLHYAQKSIIFWKQKIKCGIYLYLTATNLHHLCSLNTLLGIMSAEAWCRERFIIVFLVGKSLHVDMYAMNETFYTCVIASFKHCVPMSGYCVYRLQTGVSGRSFMLLCRYVDTTALLYFCVYKEKTYTLLSMVNKYKY